MVVIAMISPQQVHKLAINYMTHPIHAAAAVCFHRRGVRRQCSAYDGASASIGAARPHQSTPLSVRCRAEDGVVRPPPGRRRDDRGPLTLFRKSEYSGN